MLNLNNDLCWSGFTGVFSFVRFSGGFGARDYRQTSSNPASGGFGSRGSRNAGGNRGFGGAKG